MTKICARADSQAPACLQQDRIATERASRNDRHAPPRPPKKQIFPSPLPPPLRTSRTLSRGRNPRPKFCAARPESVQPGRLFRLGRPSTKQNSDRQRAEPEVTDKRAMARQKPEFGRRPSHKPSTAHETGRPKLGTPIIMCAAPVRVCADHSRVSMSCRWNTSISAYLGRRLGTAFDSLDRGIARGGV